jgi:hypothetical protein
MKAATPVHLVDPLADGRWPGLVAAHASSSAFHSLAWLNALQQAYNYTPVAFTHSAPGETLDNALLFCAVKSWITGNRLVSLPFSDHCEPLLRDHSDFAGLLAGAQGQVDRDDWKYLEVRPLTPSLSRGLNRYADKPADFCMHRLDLNPSLEELYRGLHGDSIRRRIERGHRQRLTAECGNSGGLLDEFYRLHVLTRRRQSLPPHPRRWFRAVLASFGDAASIRVAYTDRTAVSALLLISHKTTITYKYGCSDAAYHKLGGMPYLLWETIVEAKERGMKELDLGRSDLDNPGLITFKDRWGASRDVLVYLRYPELSRRETPARRIYVRAAKYVFSKCPERVLTAVGNLLYPHIG